MEQIIEAWFVKHFHGLGGKLDTEVYNIIHAAKEDLKHVLGAVAPDPAVPNAAIPEGSTSPDPAPAKEEL